MRINTKKPIEYKQLGGTVASMPDNYRGLNRRQSVARLMRDEGMSRADARNLYDTRAEQIGESVYNGAPITATNYGHEGTSRADISYDLFGDNGQFTSRGTMMNAVSPYYNSAKSMRQAYQDEKRALRNSGMRGLAMREQARNNMIGNATMPEIQFDNSFNWGSGSPIQDELLLINDYAPELSVPEEEINIPITTPVSTPTTSTANSDWWRFSYPGAGVASRTNWVAPQIGKTREERLAARAARQARRQARRQTLREDQMDALERARNQYNLPLYD